MGAEEGCEPAAESRVGRSSVLPAPGVVPRRSGAGRVPRDGATTVTEEVVAPVGEKAGRTPTLPADGDSDGGSLAGGGSDDADAADAADSDAGAVEQANGPEAADGVRRPDGDVASDHAAGAGAAPGGGADAGEARGVPSGARDALDPPGGAGATAGGGGGGGGPEDAREVPSGARDADGGDAPTGAGVTEAREVGGGTDRERNLAADRDRDGADGGAAGAGGEARDGALGRNGAGWRRWSPGTSRAGALIGLLLGLLGFAIAVQVRSNTGGNALATARQEDLVRILDDLRSREQRLRLQISGLEAARARLSTTGDKDTAALNEARTRSTALGILAGTLPAQGPGIQLTITDPARKLVAEDLLDAVEELRAAGAEAVQVGPVRIGLDSAFTDETSGIVLDGRALAAPYTLLALGDPATLATALNIPGGVVDTVRQAGGEGVIVHQQRLVIRALRTLSMPRYAQPADGQPGGN